MPFLLFFAIPAIFCHFCHFLRTAARIAGMPLCNSCNFLQFLPFFAIFAIFCHSCHFLQFLPFFAIPAIFGHSCHCQCIHGYSAHMCWNMWGRHPSANSAPQTSPSNRGSPPGTCIRAVPVHYANTLHTPRTSNVADIENETPAMAWVFWEHHPLESHPSPRIASHPPKLRTSNLTLESRLAA